MSVEPSKAMVEKSASSGRPFASAASEFLRFVVFPLHARRRHPAVYSRLAELRRHEYSPLQEILSVQSERVRRLLAHSAARVPYYRQLFQGAGIPPAEIRTSADLARLPILDKDTLRERQPELLVEKGDRRKLRLNASGGSTGKPVQLYQDDEYWAAAQASQWFVESWWGIRPGDRTASIWGTDRDLPDLHWKERLALAIAQTRICNAFALSERQLEDFARMLAEWRPRFITGYASALFVFARFLLDRPHLRIRPVAVKSTAEVLRTDERIAIEKAFQAPVCNFYGSREVNNLAAECPARAGLHVNALNRIVEVVDDRGQPAAPGVMGRILVTDLTNYAMPLIRYEIEDLGVWSERACSCGRPFPLLAEITGRKSDFIVMPSGKLIHGEFFTHMFYDLPQVSQFQLVQNTLREMSLKVVLSDANGKAVLEELTKRLEKVLGPEVRCTVEAVAEIPRGPSGKHRFTVSHVEVPRGQAGPACVAEEEGAAKR